MQKYELVLMLDPQVQDTQRKELLSKIETEFKSSFLEKDEIWLKQTTYDVHWKRWKNQVYYVSYLFELTPDLLIALKKILLYSKILIRYEIFKLKSKQEFFNYEKLQKELEKIMEWRDQKRFWNRISFLSLPENDKYINRKSVAILKKYITRFGNIKPRRYTKNSVKIQKKLRREVIRARTLWFLEFIKKW